MSGPYSSTAIPNSSNTPVLVDTHCHIHDSEYAHKYDKTQKVLVDEARAEGVTKLICVGTDAKSSREAVVFAREYENCFASVAIHPHETANHELSVLLSDTDNFKELLEDENNPIVAIGECGLDYYYHQDSDVKNAQKTLLRRHIELALQYKLPLVFHVRDAFDDFFKILDDYENLDGVVHSFSAGVKELEGCLDRGLYIGLNGIMTFSKQKDQLEAARMVPLKKLVLETDAPFLTPAPFRGKMCEPKHIRVTAEYLSDLRGESLEDFAQATTENAQKLFGIK